MVPENESDSYIVRHRLLTRGLVLTGLVVTLGAAIGAAIAAIQQQDVGPFRILVGISAAMILLFTVIVFTLPTFLARYVVSRSGILECRWPNTNRDIPWAAIDSAYISKYALHMVAPEERFHLKVGPDWSNASRLLAELQQAPFWSWEPDPDIERSASRDAFPSSDEWDPHSSGSQAGGPGFIGDVEPGLVVTRWKRVVLPVIFAVGMLLLSVLAWSIAADKGKIIVLRAAAPAAVVGFLWGAWKDWYRIKFESEGMRIYRVGRSEWIPWAEIAQARLTRSVAKESEKFNVKQTLTFDCLGKRPVSIEVGADGGLLASRLAMALNERFVVI